MSKSKIEYCQIIHMKFTIIILYLSPAGMHKLPINIVDTIQNLHHYQLTQYQYNPNNQNQKKDNKMMMPRTTLYNVHWYLSETKTVQDNELLACV